MGEIPERGEHKTHVQVSGHREHGDFSEGGGFQCYVHAAEYAQ